ncbi:MAG: hypothetical protein JKY55_01625 [Aliivibrio sp.]|uniref:hypothetical protein n=1 Tax=Aliivibrio sp. TaxID=1872443 RepID=UPI001A55CFD1|nr:hypothetical protein [Aliivibrio sp.]
MVTLTRAPAGYEEKVFLVRGSLNNVLRDINAKGFHKLYIDGGGSPLFGDLAAPLNFKLVDSTTFLDTIVQNYFKRDR